MASYIKTDKSITIVFDDGSIFDILNEQTNYNQIIEQIKEENWEEVRRLCDIVEDIKTNCPDVIINNGVVYYKGEPVHNTLTKRIIEMKHGGFNIDHLLSFLDNLMQNTSARAIKGLYEFLEYGKLPITSDGHFLAYKKVTHDYMDIHSRTISNRVGEVVSMDRNTVDDNPNNTCSYGLHFCSREYLSHFGDNSSRTVLIKINPKDVVSIPVDYNNTKGRCCKYTILCEINSDNRIEGVYNNDYDDKYDDDDYYLEDEDDYFLDND